MCFLQEEQQTTQRGPAIKPKLTFPYTSALTEAIRTVSIPRPLNDACLHTYPFQDALLNVQRPFEPIALALPLYGAQSLIGILLSNEWVPP